MARLQEYFGVLTPARDRRAKTRTTPTSLTYVALGGGDAIILNISEMGMAVAVAHALIVGEYLPCIRFELPGFSQTIEISAQVVRVSESRKGAGILFVHPSDEICNHISNWIASERTTPEFEHLPKPPRRDTRPVEISSGTSKTIFSNKSMGGGELGTRYADMFPSEGAISDIVARPNEVKQEQEPVPAIRACIEAATDPIYVTTSNIEVSSSRADDSSLDLDLLEKSAEKGSKFQFAALASLLVAVSFVLGLTAGYAPIGKRVRNARKSMLPIAVASPARPDVPGEATSATPVGNTFSTPSAQAPASEESHPEISSAPSHSRSEDSTTRARTTKSSSQTRSRGNADSHYSPGTRRLAEKPPAGENSKQTTTLGESSTDVDSKDSNSSSTIESKSSADSKKQLDGRTGSTGLATEASPETASPKPEAAQPSIVANSIADAPPDVGPRSVTSARTVPHSSPAPASVAIPAPEYGKLVRAVFPKKSIADSPSLAIASQLSVLISPDRRSSSGDRQTARLQAGDLISYAEPRQPRQGDRYKSKEIVKVRATIGTGGQVTDVRPIAGPIFLLSSVISAVRQWHFHPTLLNDAPVQAQQDVTIEFRLQR